MTVRPTVRLRLTLLYGGLFLLAGALLLVVNYGLVRSTLPPAPFVVRAAPPEGLGALPPAGDDALVPRPGPVVEAHAPDGTPLETPLVKSVEEVRRQTLQALVRQSATALGIMTVASLGLGWVVAGRVLRPLHRITSTARRLSDQNLHERIALGGPQDELKELADTFDEMLARLGAAFESQRRFIANASHELRTPLAIQRALVDVALADPHRAPEELAAVADKLRAAIDRSERLIESLLLLARSERRPEDWRTVDLAAAAAAAIDSVSGEAEANGVRVEQELGRAVASGDPALLEGAVSNLVENAVRHNRPDGWVLVTTSTEGHRGRLWVANTGGEIRQDEVEALFEPFRRLGRDRTGSQRGAGLGLSIVRAVAEAHGGEVRARPRAGGGLEVELLVPTDRPTAVGHGRSAIAGRAVDAG